MEFLIIAIAVILLLIGLAGCILPALPGPPLSYVAIILVWLFGIADFSYTQLLVWLLLVVAVQLLDFVVPMLGTKYCGGSENGKKGAIVGTLLGLFFMPWGIILGPFLGAVVGELIIGRTTGAALLSGLGSLLGFLCGTLFKVILCLYLAWQLATALL